MSFVVVYIKDYILLILAQEERFALFGVSLGRCYRYFLNLSVLLGVHLTTRNTNFFINMIM